eukprot:CAMPEP_0203655174 /NCGR_PEP_ID=MMETSP0088-20131115/37440_1 /ASSEMBLY_ACC=CAM_ASM_001087 /TAXON_ID=426623 /ORGANISM="Chaetoceros affinis, Strain CCMP159" /LENGTH=153 /DNA_ID=CAMNT_0050515699 /DNA_START=98 /DNA_END=559 /DNA_ORIENTATION=+
MKGLTRTIALLTACISNCKEGACFSNKMRNFNQRSSMTKTNIVINSLSSFLTKTCDLEHSKYALLMKPRNDDVDSDPTGMRRGLVLFPVVLLIAVWLFSIPPEFRRARICTEQQVIDYPDSKCITTSNWIAGVKDYYQKGGGLEFDFTIDPDT